MARKPSAEWSGTIVVNGVEISGKLYSAISRLQEIPVIDIHLKCRGTLSEKKKPKKTTSKPRAKPQPASHRLVCSVCQKSVPEKELAKAIFFGGKIIPLTKEEVILLEPAPKERVKAIPIDALDPMLQILGTGRRLYFFPESGSVANYYGVLYSLASHRLVGYIDELVIPSERMSYTVILKPIVLPRSFTEQREAKMLVVEAVRDVSEVKNPFDLVDLPPEPMMGFTTVDLKATRLDPESLRTPRFRKLKRLIKAKIK